MSAPPRAPRASRGGSPARHSASIPWPRPPRSPTRKKHRTLRRRQRTTTTTTTRRRNSTSTWRRTPNRTWGPGSSIAARARRYVRPLVGCRKRRALSGMRCARVGFVCASFRCSVVCARAQHRGACFSTGSVSCLLLLLLLLFSNERRIYGSLLFVFVFFVGFCSLCVVVL